MPRTGKTKLRSKFKKGVPRTYRREGGGGTTAVVWCKRSIDHGPQESGTPKDEKKRLAMTINEKSNVVMTKKINAAMISLISKGVGGEE